jgi:branched-subunit amino acid aminotransferase/4-amino-4-deoxychorismate lyase
MNLFIALKTPEGGVELVTAPLGDLVLPGVTRDRSAQSLDRVGGVVGSMRADSS